MSANEPTSFTPLTGGCQCGAIRYAVTAPLDDVNVCHCRMCQKAGGGPFLAFFNVPADAVTFIKGQPAVYASSSLAERGFCRECGTLTYQRTPADIGVTTGSLDHPDRAVPTSRLASDTVLTWSEHVGALPITDIEVWRDAAKIAPFRTHQHPDHET